jgi:hypothetical protein
MAPPGDLSSMLVDLHAIFNIFSRKRGFPTNEHKGVIIILVEQELLTLPDHLNSPPVLSGDCVTRSLVLCVCFVDRCLSFCFFSFGHCVVCSSAIYGL